jgi:2,3-bisphosphoglycerate-independent phosphoglycerate mutase
MSGKEIICLLTGLTDVPLQDLKGLTPLQKARHPYLNQLVREGSCHLLLPRSEGIEASFAALLGVKEHLETTRRAPLEAYGLGYPLTAQEVAFSLRFVGAGGETIVDVSDQLLCDRDAQLICQDLTQELKEFDCRLIHLRGPCAVLVTSHPIWTSAPLGRSYSSGEVVGKRWHEVLPFKRRERPIIDLLTRASLLLESHEVNRFRAELDQPPVNRIWLMEGGRRALWMDTRQESNQTSCVYAPSAAFQGVARSLNVPCWHFPPSDLKYGHLHSILARLDEALKQSSRLILDFPYLWESTYQGALLDKIKSIEWLDSHCIRPLFDHCRAAKSRFTLLPLSHTDIRTGKMIFAPVPYVTWPPRSDGFHLAEYDEPSFAAIKRSPLALGEVLNSR